MTEPLRPDPRLLGAALAAVAFAADQASKLWLLRSFDLPDRSPYEVVPGVDLVMAWNRGVSYSLLSSDAEFGRWLLVGATVAATAALGVWLARLRTGLAAAAVGLLIGGALGNLVDRIAYGAVVDFVYLHAGSFRWYVFNGADCAITAGVALLVLDWTAGGARPAPAEGAPKTPRSPRHS